MMEQSRYRSPIHTSAQSPTGRPNRISATLVNRKPLPLLSFRELAVNAISHSQAENAGSIPVARSK